jgi:hypothetical protein
MAMGAWVKEDEVRKFALSWLMLVTLGAAAIIDTARAEQVASSERYAGTWTGTWEGPGTGQFELTLENGKDGAPAGKVAVTTDNGNYDAALKAIAFDGSKMTAKYDFPPDPSAEVSVAADFEDRAAKGTWSLRVRGQDAEVAGGTFALTKK